MAKNNVILSNLVGLEDVNVDSIPEFLQAVQSHGLLKAKQWEKIRQLLTEEERMNEALLYISKQIKTKPELIDKLCECYEQLGMDKQMSIIKPPDAIASLMDINIRKATTVKDDKEKHYTMLSRPRGYMLLINVMEFKVDRRRGSDVDLIHLTNLWKELGYKIISPDSPSNITAQDCMSLVTKFAQTEELNDVDSVVIFVMTHGLNNPFNDHQIDLKFTDGRCINTEWIINEFSDDNCPQLKGKPKIFFFQACRGWQIDYGRPRRVRYKGGSIRKWFCLGCRGKDNDYGRVRRASTVKSDGAMTNTFTKTIGDILIIYPCVPGKVSLRDELSGAWMVQEICKVFPIYACVEDLETMLRRVSNNLKSRHDRSEGMEVLTYENRSFDKLLYFNPGLPADNNH